MKKLLAFIGFGLILWGAFRGIIHLLAGDPNGAKRASGDFLFPGLILIGIWFVLNIYSMIKRTKDVPNMTKEEYIKKHSVGTQASKVSMGNEWENEKKVIEKNK